MNNAALRDSADSLLRTWPAFKPCCAVIMGSGWSEALPPMTLKKSVPYSDIACLGAPQVPGHPGQLRLAEFHGRDMLIFMGRRHWYEGNGWEPVAFPVYLAARLHAPVLVVTNAAGGIRADLKPGDFMIIDDHINAMGAGPLVGGRDPVWGPLFTDQSEVYDGRLRDLMAEAGRQTSQALARGVYVGVPGPAYETPAEIRAFRAMGADAIGMSTVPEATLGRAAGLRVVGLSCISNLAAGFGSAALRHDDVVAIATAAHQRMRSVLDEFLSLLVRT